MNTPTCHINPRGFSIVELLAAVIAFTLLIALTVPVLGGVGSRSGIDASLNNLFNLGVAHTIYAFDYDGRQYTNIDDTISEFGAMPPIAFINFANETGEEHPPLILGWGEGFVGSDSFLFAYATFIGSGNQTLVQPIVFPGTQGIVGYGSLRFPNAQAMHDYVGSRFYEPTFFAPNDVVVFDLVEPLFADAAEFVRTNTSDLGDTPIWSSYCLSPAAMFHPDVMRAEPDGGWQDPWLLDHGFESPGLFQAMYPSLKTQMLEHHWNQSAPADVCIPGFPTPTFPDCEPYYFNHGVASSPATLFYDLSSRLLPNVEVLAADDQVLKDTGFGLWSRDTTFGESGYRGEFGFDLFSLSHHILTTNGILGRDTIAMPPGASKAWEAGSLRVGPGARSPIAPPATRRSDPEVRPLRYGP